MEKSIFNKKRWLLSRSDLILSLKQDGMTSKQVIEHLKNAEKMPFNLDESLFSRHCKAILEQLDVKKSNTTLTDKVQNLEKYTRYLESNNKKLILKNKELLKPKPKEPLPTVEPVNNEYIDDLKNQLSQRKQAEIKLLEQNKALLNERYELKLTVRRLNDEIEHERRLTREMEEKWRTTQIRAKYNMYFAYFFAVSSIMLFLFIVL
jgi:hypothetical protein